MNFLFLGIFLDFFLLILLFLNDKNDLKKCKKDLYFARDPHGCDVACKATWQRHAGPCGAYVV